jgi:hypothetical protein
MISGGGDWTSALPGLVIVKSFPVAGPTGVATDSWFVEGRNNANGGATLIAKAICLAE